MGRYNGAIQIAHALPNNIAAVDFTDWDEGTGTFLNSGLAVGAGDATPLNNPQRTPEGVALNGLNQSLKLRLATNNITPTSALLIYRPITVADYYLFDIGIGEAGTQDIYARSRSDGDLMLAAGSSSADADQAGLVIAGDIQFTTVNANATFSFSYHGTVPDINYISVGNSSVPTSSQIWAGIGDRRLGGSYAHIEVLFFGCWDNVITADELQPLLDTFNHYGRLTLPTNLESARHQSIISLGPDREVSSLGNVFNGVTDLDIRLPYESGQPVEFFAFDTDENNTNLTTGPVVPNELEPLVFNPVAGSGGDDPGTGLIAHIAGTVDIDGNAAERQVIVISDDPNGRQVLGEGMSAPDGTFDIEYNDWGGAVIALAVDNYGGDWAAETAIAVGTVIHPTTPNGYVYEATSGGTTGTGEPTWSVNGVVNDGSVPWSPRPFYRPIASGPIKGEVLQQAAASPMYDYIVGYQTRVIWINANDTVEGLPVDAAGNIDQIPAGLTNILDLSIGGTHGMALDIDGLVTVWGNDPGNTGKLDIPPGLTDVKQIAAGDNVCVALTAGGQVVAWGGGSDSPQTVPAGMDNVKAISAGQHHVLALHDDGTVSAWGYNNEGQATVPAGLSDVVQIYGGYWHSLALKSDGTLVAWGRNTEGQCTVPAAIQGSIEQVAGGFDFSCALLTDGTLRAWGDTDYGQNLVPADTDIIRVEAASFTGYAVKENGTVVTWGRTDAGNVIPGTRVLKTVNPDA